MADGTQISHEQNQTEEIVDDPQLRYPKLLIETSFESLLSHSHSSTSQTKVNMPRSERSLGESWSSLSEHDLLPDDDLHSEATDTGSLIDASNTDDVHSVNEHNDSSQDEDNDNDSSEDEEIDIPRDHDKQNEQQSYPTKLESQYQNIQPSESIRLDDSTVVVDARGTTSLQASKTFTSTEMQSSTVRSLPDDFSDETVGMIMMPLTTDSCLQLGQQPYHILYHGSSLSSPEIKSEVLGKIGAALISFDDIVLEGRSSESPCFHIVPSEFGPGSIPSTAELIPIPSQMYVSDCKISGNVSSGSSEIKLQLGAVKTVISRRARLFESQDEQHWTQPNLTVIVVSQNDDKKARLDAQRVADFASRHRIPVICLRQEGGWEGDEFLMDAHPYMLHRRVQFGSDLPQDLREKEMLLDVDAFLALDSEQLNQHLRFLADLSEDNSQNRSSLQSYLTTQSRRAMSQLSTVLPSTFVKLIGCADDDNSNCRDWVVDATSAANQTYQPKGNQSWSGFLPEDNRSLLSALQSGAVALAITALVLLLTASSLGALPYLLSLTGSKTLGIAAGPEKFVCSSKTISSQPVTTTVATADQVYALAGPFQAIEQQVQNWMPAKVVGGQTKTPELEHKDDITTLVCHEIMSAHIFPNLKVNTTFFKTGEPSFDVRVFRDEVEIPAKVEKYADEVAFIMVPRREHHGRLTVHLHSVDERTCASVNLQDLVHEAVTLWFAFSDDQKPKTARHPINRYGRLLEVRTAKPGLVNSAIELS